MARRNIYLTDDLDRRVRAAIDAGQLDASDVCAVALGHALNGHQAAAGPEVLEQRQEDSIAGQLAELERMLHQLNTAVGFALLLLGIGVAVVSVRAFVTS
jgi:hypothetical protein